MLRTLSLRSLIALAALAAPATAAATDIPVAADPAVQHVAALDGTLVWVSGAFGHQKLMQLAPDGTVATVKGAPEAASYSTVDLGRDADGRVVLTYRRCASVADSSCRFLRDDLDGRRSSFRGLAPSGCELSTAPALWRSRAAYGLLCRKDRTEDTTRSGLYVKQRGHAPRHLPLRQRLFPFKLTNVTAVDLRGTRVAALAAGGAAQVALTESVAGSGARSFVAADSEGDTGQSASGAQLGTGGALWTVTDTEHLDDPLQSTIKRLSGSCLDFETLDSPPGAQPPAGFRATDLAVDGHSLYLVVPGTGIVSHTFAPTRPCGPA